MHCTYCTDLGRLLTPQCSHSSPLRLRLRLLAPALSTCSSWVGLGWLLEYLSCLAPLCSALCVADKLPLSLGGSGQRIGWIGMQQYSYHHLLGPWRSSRSDLFLWTTSLRTQPWSFTGTLTACCSKTANPRAQKRLSSEHVGPLSSGLFICGPRIFPSESLMRPLCDPKSFRRRHCAS